MSPLPDNVVSSLLSSRDTIAASIFSANAYIFAAATSQVAFYTISAILFVLCIYKSFSPSPNHSKRSLASDFWLNSILILLFLLTTTNTIVHLQFFRLVLVENAANPKFAKVLNTPYHIVPNLLIGLTAVVGDGLMIWRCFIIWGSSYLIIILPTLMTLTVFGMTLAWTHSIALNQIQNYINLGFGVIPLSCATNVLVTFLIAFRIIWTSKQIKGVIMDTRVYGWVIGILVESASLYAITGICTVGTFLAGHPSEQVMISLYMVMPSISAYLIVLRVRMGLGYENTTLNGGSKGTVSTLVIAGSNRKSRSTRNTTEDGGQHELSTVRMGQTVLVRDDYTSMDMGSWGATTKSEGGGEDHDSA